MKWSQISYVCINEQWKMHRETYLRNLTNLNHIDKKNELPVVCCEVNIPSWWMDLMKSKRFNTRRILKSSYHFHYRQHNRNRLSCKFATRNAAFQSTGQSTASLKLTRMDVHCFSWASWQNFNCHTNLRLLVADRQSRNEIQ